MKERGFLFRRLRRFFLGGGRREKGGEPRMDTDGTGKDEGEGRAEGRYGREFMFRFKCMFEREVEKIL